MNKINATLHQITCKGLPEYMYRNCSRIHIAFLVLHRFANRTIKNNYALAGTADKDKVKKVSLSKVLESFQTTKMLTAFYHFMKANSRTVE